MRVGGKGSYPVRQKHNVQHEPRPSRGSSPPRVLKEAPVKKAPKAEMKKKDKKEKKARKAKKSKKAHKK